EVRVADVFRHEGRKVAPADRLPGPDRVERAGRPAGLAVGRPQLDLAPAVGPEGLVGDHPAEAGLRVDLETEALTEGAVAVDAHAGRQEVPVGDVQHVLEEETGVPDPLPLLFGDPDGGRADRRLRGAGEDLAPALELTRLVPDRLAAPGEVGPE